MAFYLHHAAYTPPPLPGPLMSPRFWHAHLNHACTRAVSPLAGTTDNMVGDQLAIWNQVNVRSHEPIPSTHLTIFVPPALGAFILANLKSPKRQYARFLVSNFAEKGIQQLRAYGECNTQGYDLAAYLTRVCYDKCETQTPSRFSRQMK